MVADAVLASQIEQFADAGADLISVHAENANAAAALETIAAEGPQGRHRAAAALAGRRGERPFSTAIGMLTLLGTRIGVKGQDLDAEAETALARGARPDLPPKAPSRRVVLAADGGIREHTVPGLRKAGAETIVMGSLAFGAKDLAQRMAWVRAMPGGG